MGSPFTLPELEAAWSSQDLAYLKADGVYNRSTNFSPPAGNLAAPTRVIGANSSWVVDGTRAVIKATANSILLCGGTTDYLWFDCIEADGDSRSGVSGIQENIRGRVTRCLAKNCPAVGIQVASQGMCSRSGARACGIGIFADKATWCYARGCSGDGFNVFDGSHLIASLCGGVGINGIASQGVVSVRYSVAHGCTGNGMQPATWGENSEFYRCLSVLNGGYGYSGLGFVAAPESGGYGNTSGLYNSVTPFDGLTLTADPFTDPTNNEDFSLNPSGPEYAALKAMGFTFPSSATLAYPAAGAVQPLGGGGSALYGFTMEG